MKHVLLLTLAIFSFIACEKQEDDPILQNIVEEMDLQAIDDALRAEPDTGKYTWNIPASNLLTVARSNNGSGWNTPWWNKKILKGHYIQWADNHLTDGQYPGKGSGQNNFGWFRGKSYHFGTNNLNSSIHDAMIVTFHRGEKKLSIVKNRGGDGDSGGRKDHLGFALDPVTGAEMKSLPYETAEDIDEILMQSGYSFE